MVLDIPGPPRIFEYAPWGRDCPRIKVLVRRIMGRIRARVWEHTLAALKTPNQTCSRTGEQTPICPSAVFYRTRCTLENYDRLLTDKQTWESWDVGALCHIRITVIVAFV